MSNAAARPGRKPCVNCTCATTGFCPRGVGANIPPELAAANPAPAGKPLSAAAPVKRLQVQPIPADAPTSQTRLTRHSLTTGFMAGPAA